MDRLIRIAIAILVGAWVARYLGPAQYGELAYSLAIIALIYAACSLGLDGPVVRDIAHSPLRTPVVLGSAFKLRLGAGLIGWIAAIALVLLLQPGDWLALKMVAIAGVTLFFNPAEVVDLWLQSQGKSKLAVPCRFAAYAAVALTKVVLILLKAPLWAFAAVAALDSALIAAALLLVYRRWPAQGTWTWDTVCARRLLSESWPLMLSALAVSIYMRIDQIMLRELADERQLGLYSAILPFSQAWHMVPMTLCASLLPTISQLQKTDPQRYRLRLQQLFTLMAWSGIMAATLTALCAQWLVSLLLGSSFIDAVPVLQWHVFSNVFVFLGVTQSVAIVSERTPRKALVNTCSGAVASLVANYLLIPSWGAVGAAWSAIIAYCMAAMMANALVSPGTFRMQLRAFIPTYASSVR